MHVIGISPDTIATRQDIAPTVTWGSIMKAYLFFSLKVLQGADFPEAVFVNPSVKDILGFAWLLIRPF